MSSNLWFCRTQMSKRSLLNALLHQMIRRSSESRVKWARRWLGSGWSVRIRTAPSSSRFRPNPPFTSSSLKMTITSTSMTWLDRKLRRHRASAFSLEQNLCFQSLSLLSLINIRYIESFSNAVWYFDVPGLFSLFNCCMPNTE